LAERVLVVDDAPEMRTLIARVLGAAGYQVDVAASLARARALHPDGYAAVLVDARLGAERGMDLIDELRAGDPAAVSRCLVITGGETRPGPDGPRFLAKPFQPAELLAAVRALPGQAADPGTSPAVSSTLSPARGRARGRSARPAPVAGADPVAADGVSPAVSAVSGTPPGANGMPRAASGTQVRQLLAITRQLRARERHELIDYLHDGPMQELTAATLEAQLMRSSVPGSAATRFDAVLAQLDAAARALRWLVDGDLPLSQPELELSSALRQRTTWLLDAPVMLRSADAGASLSPADVPAIVDVAELMLLRMLPAGQAAQACIAVRAKHRLIQLELTVMPTAPAGRPAGDRAGDRGGDLAGDAAGERAGDWAGDRGGDLAGDRGGDLAGDPAAARLALDELAAALGGTAQAEFSPERWQARIELPWRA